VARDFALNTTSDLCLFQIFFNASAFMSAPELDQRASANRAWGGMQAYRGDKPAMILAK
jgi:hypothetical protein